MFQIHAEGKDPDFRQEQRFERACLWGVDDAADVFIFIFSGANLCHDMSRNMSRHLVKHVTTCHHALWNFHDMPRHVVKDVTTCYDLSWIFSSKVHDCYLR